MDQQIQNKRTDLLNLSVKDLFFKYVRFLPLFLLALALALLIAFVYLRYATNYYRATGTVVIKTTNSPTQNDKVESILSGNTGNSTIQNEMEVLKSRALMKRVVNRLHLQFGYTAKGKIKEQNVYKQAPFFMEGRSITDSSQAFSYRIKKSGNDKFRINDGPEEYTFGQEFTKPEGSFVLRRTQLAFSEDAEYSVTWNPTETIASSFAPDVVVMPKTAGTNMLTITFETNNPYLATDIVNTLMREYDAMTIEQNNLSADKRIAFIIDRLKILDRELDTLQLRFLKYKQDNNLIDVEKQLAGYFEKVTEADKSVVDQQFNLFQAENIFSYLKDKANQYTQVAPTSLTLQDLTLNELVMSYNKAQLQRQALLDANIPSSNPAVKEVEGQIETIRESLLENLRIIQSSYRAAINGMQNRGRAEESKLQALPFKLKSYVEMERQINTKLALYTLIEEKREEAAIGRASTVSNSEIVDEAIVNFSPVKPNKRMIQLLAALIGIGLPALVIFFVEVMNDRITTRLDIENVTQTPVIGEIGHSYASQVLVVNTNNRGMVAEQFRIVRSNLQYIVNKTTRPVIMVTSSFSGEGKSFISTNMGAVLALTGKKTIVLEYDIRKPKVLSGLGMSKRSGISNYLVGQAKLEDLIVPVPDHDNLFVLPSGPIPPNPAELLLDDKVEEMFEWLRNNFEIVVVDTAPVGIVSDAMTLGKFADCTLYIVRQGHTYKKQVVLIDELYQEAKLPKVSIVINDVKLKPGYGYYGYGRYGYGYGAKKNGAGYYDEDDGVSSFSLKKFIAKIFRRKK